MKIQIDLNPNDGRMKIYVNSGTFEEAKEAIEELLGYLTEKGIKLDDYSDIESHRHGETEEETHSHIHRDEHHESH